MRYNLVCTPFYWQLMLAGDPPPAYFSDGYHSLHQGRDGMLAKALEVSLYTLGGMIAGKIIQTSGKKKKKK